MGKQTKGPLPAEVEELQMQLQEWRLTRKGSCPIPAPIWDAAVPLAIRFGVCRIGRAVGLDYTWLRKKVARAKEASSSGGTTFLELPAEMVLPAPCAPQSGGQESGWFATAGAVVEISTPDGAQFRMRLQGAAVDTAGIVAAFLRGGR
jgi:hypothetical protein